MGLYTRVMLVAITGGACSSDAGNEDKDSDPCTVLDECRDIQTCGCSGPELCPEYAGRAVVRAYEEPVEIEGPWQCVLEAFRTNTPGRLKISIDNGGDDGYLHKIVIIGDGSAVYTDPAPDNGDEETSRHVSLYDAAYYQGCLDGADTAANAACLLSWFSEDLCTPVTCCPESLKPEAPPACE